MATLFSFLLFTYLCFYDLALLYGLSTYPILTKITNAYFERTRCLFNFCLRWKTYRSLQVIRMSYCFLLLITIWLTWLISADYCCTLKVIDESHQQPGMTINIFAESPEGLPHVAEAGDIIQLCKVMVMIFLVVDLIVLSVKNMSN